jgi:gas vesicle protein
VLGSCAALLLAPRSGRGTRRLIAGKADDLKENIVSAVHRVGRHVSSRS